VCKQAKEQCPSAQCTEEQNRNFLFLLGNAEPPPVPRPAEGQHMGEAAAATAQGGAVSARRALIMPPHAAQANCPHAFCAHARRAATPALMRQQRE